MVQVNMLTLHGISTKTQPPFLGAVRPKDGKARLEAVRLRVNGPQGPKPGSEEASQPTELQEKLALNLIDHGIMIDPYPN